MTYKILFWILLLPIFLIDIYKTFIDPSIATTITKLVNVVPYPLQILIAIIWLFALLYLFPYRRRRK